MDESFETQMLGKQLGKILERLEYLRSSRSKIAATISAPSSLSEELDELLTAYEALLHEQGISLICPFYLRRLCS